MIQLREFGRSLLLLQLVTSIAGRALDNGTLISSSASVATMAPKEYENLSLNRTSKVTENPNGDAIVKVQAEENKKASNHEDLSLLHHDLKSGFGKLTKLTAPYKIFTYQMLQNCNVDFRHPGSLVEALLQGDRNAFVSGVDVCNAQEASQFTDATNSFERCAGFDVLQLSTQNAAALGKTVFGCLDALETREQTTHAVEHCTNLALSTGLWKAVNSFGQYSQQICPCLPTLGHHLPNCILDQDGNKKEIKLDGPALQLSSCLLGQLCSSLDSLCQIEVDKLNACLPSLENNQGCDSMQHDCHKAESWLFTAPYPIAGSSFPDRCQSVATNGKYVNTHIIERYNVYRNQCILKSDNRGRDFGDPEEHNITSEQSNSKDDIHLKKQHPQQKSSWKMAWEEATRQTRVLAGGVGFLVLLCLGTTAYAYRRAKKRYSYYAYKDLPRQVLGDGSDYHDEPSEPFSDHPDDFSEDEDNFDL